MTATEEFLSPPGQPRGSAAPGTLPRGYLTLSCARGLEEQRAATEHRRRRQLVLVGAGTAALGLALALILSWEADRWLTDMHYGVADDAVFVLPDAQNAPDGAAR